MSGHKPVTADLADQNCPESSQQSLIPCPQQKTLVDSKAYGKGRVLRRKPGDSSRLAFPPQRAIVEKPPSRELRYAAWLEEGSLPLWDLIKVADGEAAWQALRRCHPAHLRNSGLIGQLGTKLNLLSMGKFFSDGPDVTASICIGKTNTIMHCVEEKNLFGSEYHIREPCCKSKAMPFAEASRHLQQWKERGILLKISTKGLLPGKSGIDFRLRRADDCPEALHDLLDAEADWTWLETLKDHHRMGSVASVNLEIGANNTLLPAQYSIRDRIVTQIRGNRRLLLIDPSYSFKGLYPYPVYHPYDSYSMVDWENPDQVAWPMSNEVRGRSCLLKPGDIIFVPSNWLTLFGLDKLVVVRWLIQQLQDGENITLSITLGLSQKVKPEPAVALRVSRVVEEIIGDLDGPSKILHWLQTLSEEEEMQSIDVSTVAGYEQIVAVWEARAVVDSVLGRRAWKDLFPAMCRRRLRPTPWLNKDFVEPLYLTDKPRRIVDNRTEEQQNYPELFRHVKW